MSTTKAKARCNRLLSVDLLGTPRERCWRAAGHEGPCPQPTRGNDVRMLSRVSGDVDTAPET